MYTAPMLGSSAARVRGALALACAIHAVALASLYVWRAALVPHTAVVVADDDLELDIELEPEPEPQVANSEAASVPAVDVAGPVAGPSRVAPRASRASEAASASVEVGEEVSPADEALAGDPAPDRVVDLGLGADAWRHWTRTGQTETPPKPKSRKRATARAFHAPPASTTGGLLEGLEAHDRQLGLGPSGPVINALYRAAHTPDAPRIGAARFEVTVLKTGSVEVTLVSASDRSAEWAKVGVLAAEAIRKTPPPISEPRSGTRMLIAVVAEEVFPNGTKRKQLDSPRIEAVAPQLRSTTDAEAKLKEQNPVSGDTGAPVTGQPVILDIPGIYLAGRGAICSYRIGISLTGPMLSGGCDPGNSKAQRMVRTEVEEQAMF